MCSLMTRSLITGFNLTLNSSLVKGSVWNLVIDICATLLSLLLVHEPAMLFEESASLDMA